MTNEEKANSILDSNYYVTIGERIAAYNAAMEMAEWKEQQMIQRVCEWLNENYQDYCREIDYRESLKHSFDIALCIEDFKKAMEE